MHVNPPPPPPLSVLTPSCFLSPSLCSTGAKGSRSTRTSILARGFIAHHCRQTVDQYIYRHFASTSSYVDSVRYHYQCKVLVIVTYVGCGIIQWNGWTPLISDPRSRRSSLRSSRFLVHMLSTAMQGCVERQIWKYRSFQKVSREMRRARSNLNSHGDHQYSNQGSYIAKRKDLVTYCNVTLRP